MKVFKNIVTGFIISFLGAIPLGYLNLFGLNIYSSEGFASLVCFLLGIVTVEMIIVVLTLKGTLWLLSQKRLVLLMEILSVAFLMLFAIYFFFHKNSTASITISKTIALHPYLLGLALSALNFFQIPFWAGWNLVVVETKRISTENILPYFYVLGTALGTLGGMTAFAFGFNLVINKTTSGTQWMNALLPLIFLALASIQVYKLMIKYNTAKVLRIQNGS